MAHLGHSIAMHNNRLYFFGGIKIDPIENTANSTNDLFYLDLSVKFNLDSKEGLPWVDLTNKSGIPVKSSWSTVSLGGENSSTFYLIGGTMKDFYTSEDVNDTVIYAYDLETGLWSIPDLIVIDKDSNEIDLTKESTLQQRDYIQRVVGAQSVHDELGTIYVFGGTQGPNANVNFGDLIIFDSKQMIWDIYNGGEFLHTRVGFTATLLSNGIIIYIGGLLDDLGNSGNLTLVEMNHIWTFDTSTHKWVLEMAEGESTSGRYHHTSVLTFDGLIIVYGGINTAKHAASPDIVVLDTIVYPLQWIVPDVDETNKPASRALHSAVSVGTYMLIAFGNLTSKTSPPSTPVSDIHILDITNYKWITEYYPRSPSIFSTPNVGFSFGIQLCSQKNPRKYVPSHHTRGPDI
ncbi:12978_t:CDS:2 [Funneliformis caledonium]|uniref:12978_t:CDS:1 n=1 Tax=Funneliformis caledonium TaxID=1117310 RepID=A0A9N8ZQE5_9GLOM|nr:12978_t:CDS:2 [Funneliformis caledonium]